MPLIDDLKTELKGEEGFIPYAYQDPQGYWTIGTGILIDKRKGGGITREEDDMLLTNRANTAIEGARDLFSNFDDLTQERQQALASMCYNMGKGGLSEFKQTIAAIEDEDYDKAADHILASLAAKQNPKRYQDYANIIRG